MEDSMKTATKTAAERKGWFIRATKIGALSVLAACNLILASYAPPAAAEDIDIFTVNPAIAGLRPNVLILLDNSANWNGAFSNEKAALVSTVNGLDDRFNVGLMNFAETGGGNQNPTDDGYIRSHVRQMTTVNKAALAGVVNNFHILDDKSNNVGYGLAMAEAYRYFRGARAYSGIGQKKRDFFGNVLSGGGASNTASNVVYALPGATEHAFSSAAANTYNSPISDACQKNFIILISNGPATDSNNGSNTDTATSQLSDAGGSTAAIGLTPNGSQQNVGDEWARYLANTDVNASITGDQNVITYTVDVNPGTTGQGPGHTALLKSMANVGKGKYFAVSSGNGGLEIANALNEIFQEVLSVNSVFAASALPASVNARGTFLNQVYMGMFRPDPQARPRWAGNLKQYKLGEVSGKVVLVDSNSPARAIENQVTGFINDNVRSFWTQTSSFWNASTYPEAQGSSGVSDSPDGPMVEKGGAAYRLRTVHATDVTTRRLFTCPVTGGCTSGAALSTTFNTTNADLSAATLGDAALTKDEVIRWVRGENRKLDDNATATNTLVRGYLHGDVVHSKPAIVNDSTGIWVFYGANDGVLHAVKGGPSNSDGYETWGFVAPEFFDRFARLYKNSPTIVSGGSNSKPYFFDGPMSIHTIDNNGDGTMDSGDQRILFASARRGGRLIYAFDITDPSAPKFLWKITNATTGFSELGLTFGEVRVAKIRGQTSPVAVIAAGYDAGVNDTVPRGSPATMGRGVFLVNALDGTLIWHASGSVATGGTTRNVPGMDFAVAADPVVIDSNADGFADRIYLADTAANLWRVNVDSGGSNLPSTWAAAKLAALGGSGSNDRKFMQAPDVVPFDASFDAVLIGSGDRENPLDTTIQNHFYMIKDAHAVSALPTSAWQLADLYDATSSYSVPANANGWYFGLATGEKVVTGATTLNGATFFSTNRPQSTLPSGTSCNGGLGQARDYVVNFRTSGPVRDLNVNGTLTVDDRSEVRAGGGLPPSPVAVTVCDGLSTCAEVVLSGSKTTLPPPVQLGRRYRSFWNLQTERK
jgi:type IV pilus assembly protein PilY1